MNILEDIQEAKQSFDDAEERQKEAKNDAEKARSLWDKSRDVFWELVGPPPIKIFWQSVKLDWRRMRMERHYNSMDMFHSAISIGFFGFLGIVLFGAFGFVQIGTIIAFSLIPTAIAYFLWLKVGRLQRSR